MKWWHQYPRDPFGEIVGLLFMGAGVLVVLSTVFDCCIAKESTYCGLDGHPIDYQYGE